MIEAVKRLEDYDTQTRHQATVVSSERITPEASDEEVRFLRCGSALQQILAWVLLGLVGNLFAL